MRIATFAIALFLLLALSGKEAFWRLRHSELPSSSGATSSSLIAEVRRLPEGSPVPYGVGVFVSSRWAFVKSIQSELVFGGYCASIQASFPSDEKLEITCQLRDGTPHTPSSSVKGVAVEVTLNRLQKAGS